MKHAKTLLAWMLVLSLVLGLAITTGTVKATDAPLTVTRVVENSSTGVVEIYFSEPVTLTKNGANYSPFSMVFTNATATAYGQKLNNGGAAKWERMTAADGLILSEDGTKLTFDWAVAPEVLQFSYAQLSGYETKMGYRYGLAIRDFAASADDGFIDNIVAQADPSKKLTANTMIDGMDHLFFEDIEYARPYLTGVDKVDGTHYRFNFSEPVNISSSVRVAIRLYSNDGKMTHYAAAQRLIEGNRLEYTVSEDKKSITFKVEASDVNHVLGYYSSQYDFYIQLLDGTDSNPTLMDLITAVDDGKAAIANVNGGSAADAVSWCVTELMYPKVLIGDNGYDTVAGALAVATSGKTVKLFQDNNCDGETLVVPSGVTLDLNGKTLTTDNLIAFGNVVDNAGGGKLVMSNDRTEALLSLLPSNTQLPLYDEEAGAYKFYTYTMEALGTKDVTSSSVKFGLRLSFADDSAYALLKSGQVELGMQLTVTRGSNTSNLRYVFRQSTVDAYADAMLESDTYAIVLMITGMQAGDEISAAPLMQSATGITALAATTTHVAE